MRKLSILLLTLMFLSSILFYSALPTKMPMHWNIYGQIDRYMKKDIAVALLPLLTAGMFILFKVIPQFDPKKNKYKLFKKEWEIIQTTLIGFFTYLHFMILLVSIHPELSFVPLLFFGMGILFIIIGYYLPKVKQNYFVGIKIPWTLTSVENWNKTHQFGGKCFMISGIIILFEAFFFWNVPLIIFGSIFLSAVLPIIYSYILFSSSHR